MEIRDTDCKVILLPVGPESPHQGKVVLFEGSLDDATAFYQDQREEAATADQALVLVGPDDEPVYACS